MKTMTFSGRTMREAIALAKARFGAEVDILDSGSVGDEVQVTVVVPVSRSAARRRRAIEQVSSGINALATTAARREASAGAAGTAGEAGQQLSGGSGPQAAAGGEAQPVRGAGTQEAAADAAAARGVTLPPQAGQGQADAVATPAVVAASDGTAVAAGAAPAAGQDKVTKSGRTTRAGRTGRAAARGAGKAGTADETAASGKVAGTSSEVGAGSAVAGGAAAEAVPTVAAVPAAAQVGTPAVAGTGGVVPAVATGAREAPAAGRGADPAVPLSTLDFELQRRLRQQGLAVGVAGADDRAGQPLAGGSASAAATAAAAVLPTGEAAGMGMASSPQSLVMPGSAPGGEAVVMSMPSGGGVVRGLAGEVPDLASNFAAMLQARQASSSPPESPAWPAPERPVSPPWQAGAASAGMAQGVPPAAAAEPAAATAPDAAAVAAHVAQAPRSLLWTMVDSARRMFRRRRLWSEAAETVVGAATESGVNGFASAPAMSLASTLTGGADDWPSLQLPGLEGGLGSMAQTVQAAAAGAGAQAALGWFESVRRRPAQMRLLRRLLECQFSPALARTLVGLLPADYGDVQADEWLRQTLLRALAGVNAAAGLSSGGDQGLFDRGGVFALIGPTGVGKTTSIAKIAAHHVLRHGPRQLALITADVYRIGAQEQLRAFGRMLGVPVQVAQDRDVLQALLKEHEDRSLVLIDTAGIGQRDERVSQLTAALELSQVKRVLVMNAATQSGSLEEVLDAFGARDTAGVLLSKVDEAVGLGGCLDAMVRHRLPLIGYTDGQRVPEDYHPASFAQLIEQALARQAGRHYRSLAMTDSELRNLFEDSHV